MRLQSFDYAGQFLAVLRLDVRPEDLLRGLAEEGPVLLLVVRQLGGDLFVVVLNLGGQQVAVLEADLGGRAFQVDLDPAVALGRAGGFLQPRVGLRFAGNQRKRQPQQKERRKKRDVRRIPAIIVKARTEY